MLGRFTRLRASIILVVSIAVLCPVCASGAVSDVEIQPRTGDQSLVLAMSQSKDLLGLSGSDASNISSGGRSVTAARATQDPTATQVASDDSTSSRRGLQPLWLIGCAVLGFSVVARRRLSDFDA